MKLKDFSKEIDVARQNIYRIFTKDFIDTELLMKILAALHHDFFQYFQKGYSGHDNREKRL